MAGMHEEIARADKLWSTADNTAPGQQTASIALFGYDALPGLADAASADRAEPAAKPLDRFPQRHERHTPGNHGARNTARTQLRLPRVRQGTHR
ncbi:alpha/beta hydrolase [Streptomyces nigrescens]|uniref:alpha/beta hydrolase n=2 Tax=Streptomyces nigrescens TaxID=1920 RepID=UPI00360896CA